MPETTIDWLVREGGRYLANIDDEINKLTAHPFTIDAQEACDLRRFSDVLASQARCLSSRASTLMNAADTYTGPASPFRHVEELVAEDRAGEHREDD